MLKKEELILTKKFVDFLMVQRLRIRLSMQVTWIRSLIWGDSTGHRATKSVCHNCLA